ncbi:MULTISPECIES: ATP-dependent helicase [unclassified Campylobacter]|uniref:ATP-dependent helicase n=1 Tax=unclassified Campylobacter TaxID=2593542 RepID=UPI0022E9E563|nr:MULTISPECIES: UvrD-helicase domain-containing protein [unclassified Campylobacter]MDA3078908.1 UvrD-helicase domain-containing protein [Campylobacter sp. CS_NA2]MDA3080801.1 UvrD-helicase domain-containing protein [Campylobacter sp. CS_NA1]MDA3084995.1 UvrD-helicase domain-containing protein [Campylobacter sp. CS_ED1]MDA3089771.1 UvrD-helicase domain-containing protein [Campylobacter sp. CS_ED2]WBR51670.1 UvrD-helicase domain-containing protein [Campylobacter sp. CS_NA3]
MEILNDLNPSQKKAATHIDGAMLILAGAGSGKTKTITTRLAYLLANGIDPASTLTLTFTNKAANEMRQRALNLIKNLNLSTTPLLCTFHKFGLLFLKFHINELGRKNNFSVIDTDDKKRIIKSFESDLPTSTLANEISKYKNSLLDYEDVLQNANLIAEEIGKISQGFYLKTAEIYKKYEEYLKTNNLVDFDDLLVLTYKILEKNEALCDEVSRRYQYITVDEYQDTNDIQFKILKLLCKCHENLVVVGDDDQSIYGWRGAKVENILNFKDQFESVKVIRLEENYRSTTQILAAANELIDHNRNRLGKNLKSVKGDGDEIELMESGDETYEANKISAKIQLLISQGVNPSEIAILYRVNALSRSIEEGLNKAKIPYKMVGGVKFYERAEIKDAIAYLRLILNENDDFSLRRIINRPKRGLGKVGLAKLEKIAYDNKISLVSAINLLSSGDISKKSHAELLKFANSLKETRQMDGIYNILNEFDKAFGLKDYYESLPDGSERIANLNEFYALLKDEALNKENFDLEEFLNETTLLSEQDGISGESISIMSVHASKGLEFEHLFVIGLEEGFFPLIGDGTDIEEERRLAYVALTRAKKSLSLSRVESRFYKGKRERLEKSRFLNEIGVSDGALVIQSKSEYKKGDLIKHKLFGIGRVISVTKVRNEQKLKINFGGIEREIMSNFVSKAV